MRLPAREESNPVTPQPQAVLLPHGCVAVILWLLLDSLSFKYVRLCGDVNLSRHLQFAAESGKGQNSGIGGFRAIIFFSQMQGSLSTREMVMVVVCLLAGARLPKARASSHATSIPISISCLHHRYFLLSIKPGGAGSPFGADDMADR